MAGTALALYLDGLMQSWGYQSRFDRRTTLSYPTRSGVLGLICAAMGIDRADTKGLERLAPLHMTVYAFEPGDRMIDYHTVGGGYDKKTERQHIVTTAKGTVGDPVQTYREYLLGARFGVVVEGEPSLIAEVASALRDPRWGTWLGRKSCIPASPVCQGTFDDAALALAQLVEVAGRPPVRCVRTVERFDEGTATFMDTPLSFSERRFAPRRVADEHLGSMESKGKGGTDG
jgi:CRISPR system Cascade subunit CasD